MRVESTKVKDIVPLSSVDVGVGFKYADDLYIRVPHVISGTVEQHGEMSPTANVIGVSVSTGLFLQVKPESMDEVEVEVGDVLVQMSF